MALTAAAFATVPSAQAAKPPYFSFGSPGTRGGQFPTVGSGFGVSPSPAGSAVNTAGEGSGAAAGDVYVVDREANRIQQFHANGDFVRAFGWDVVFGGEHNSGANEQQTVDVPSGVTGGSFKLTLAGAAGIGTLTKGSKKVIDVVTNTGAFAVGQTVSGEGIPPGATIAAVAGSTLVLSTAAAASTTQFLSATETTASIEWNAAATGAGGVQERLEALPSIGAGGVTVSGGPGASGTPFAVTFGGGAVGHNNITPMSVTESTLTGGGASVATAVEGGGYEICAAASSPVDLCQLGQASNAAGGMSAPQGIAIDPATGNVFVTDQGNRRVDVFSADGVFQGAFGWGVDTGTAAFQFCTAASTCQAPAAAGAAAGQFGTAIGYPAVGPSGNLFVADKTNRRVDQFSFTLNGSDEVTNAAFVNGFGWGVDTNTGAFQVCTTASTCNAGVTSSPGNPGQFALNQPVDVAVDSTGAVYAVESTASGANKRRVHKFTPQVGPPVFAAAAFDDADLSGTTNATAPSNIAIGPSDRVFVVKAFPVGVGTPPATAAERRVLEVNPAGTELLDTHMANSAINSVNGLSVDSSIGQLTSGRMYVSSGTSAGGQQVYVFIDPPTHAPAVVTGGSAPGANFALQALEGTVNPAEFKVSDCRFEYGTSTEYGADSPCVPAAAALGEGTSDVPVSAETEPLEPSTTYHYRLVAENVGLPGLGEDRTFTTGPAPPDSCENAERRAEQGIAALPLPACMALEMVSPPRKAGAPARSPNVSADGSRVSFQAKAALGEDPPGLSFFPLYVASRGGAGWASETTFPDASPRFRTLWEASSQAHPSFTPDFSRWLGIGATAEQAGQGVGRAYEAGLGGFFRPLSEPRGPLTFNSTTAPIQVVGTTVFQGGSADHSHLVFSPGAQATYFSGDPSGGGEAADDNVYLARTGAGGAPEPLELLNRDRSGEVWGGNCAARLGGIGEVPNASPPNGERNQGAVSADGSRTYLSARVDQPPSGTCSTANKLRILERLETPAGPQIVPLFASECSRPPSPNPPGPCQELSGDDLYQGASLDQSKVYFTTNRQLADSDIDGSGAECSLETAGAGCDLYLYDGSRPAGERLVQVSAGEDVPGEHEAGKEADVYNGIPAISADGSHVYFVATGVLTEDENPAADSAQLGEPNLYLWEAESEQTTFLGTLAAPLGQDPGDLYSGESGLWGGNGTWRNDAYPVPVLSAAEQGGERGEEGGDGHILVFQSKAELTPEDGDGRHRDAYRYDGEAETLTCLSCLPGSSESEPDSAPFDVDGRGEGFPLGTDFAESGRWVSEDGGEVGFATPQALLPGDVNGDLDAYLWRQGSLARLPGRPFVGAGTQNKDSFLSHDGSTVAFATPTPLLPQDGDTAADVYVARVGGGFPNQPAPEECEPGNPSDECRPAPPPSPPRVTGKALEAGNVRPRPCRKGKVRRHGRCVRRHTRKRHAGGGHRARHANTDRRAGR